MSKLAIICFTIFLSAKHTLSQHNFEKQIKLEDKCFFDAQKRKVVDSVVNKTATVGKKFGYIILTIDNKKYLTCNLPLNLKYKRLIVTGYILQTFETEKVIATPLKLTKAKSV